jgi:hypothetical protein
VERLFEIRSGLITTPKINFESAMRLINEDQSRSSPVNARLKNWLHADTAPARRIGAGALAQRVPGRFKSLSMDQLD